MQFAKYSFIFLTAFGVTLALGFENSVLSSRRDESVTSGATQIASPFPTLAFTLEDAPSDSIKGTIIKMAGEVSWQGRTATEAARIASPRIIQQGENLITGSESSLSLNFSDAVTITMSEDTEVDVIQTLPSNILFSQTTGSAVYLENSTYPVSVRARYLIVNVDGEISVSYDSKRPIITLKINSGSASVAYNDRSYVSHLANLTSGQSYIFNYQTRRGVRG